MTFDIKRIFLYVRMISVTKLRKRLIRYAVTCGIYIGIVALLNVMRDIKMFYLPLPGASSADSWLLKNIYLVWAMFMTSQSFNIFHKKSTAMYAFTLPASPEEKYFGMLIFSYVVNVLGSVVSLIIIFISLYLILSGWSNAAVDVGVFFRHTIDFFIELSVFFTFFFCGSVFFKKNQFFKTIVSLILLSIFITVLFTSLKMRLQSVPFIDIGRVWLPVSIGGGGGLLALILGYIKFRKLQYV